MDEELEIPKSEPKISDVEVILVGMFFGLLDVIDLIPIAGDITDVVAAPMGFFYWMKGINGTSFIVAEVLDLIPGVQEIPSRTIAWGITVWLDRHPKIEAKLGTVIAATDAFEGNLAEAEGAAEGEMQTASTGNRTVSMDQNESIGSEQASNGNTEGEQSTDSRPSEQKINRGQSSVQQANQEGGTTEGQDGDNGPGGFEENQTDPMEMGAEISPSQEATQADFELPETPSQGQTTSGDEDTAQASPAEENEFAKKRREMQEARNKSRRPQELTTEENDVPKKKAA